MDRVPDLRNFSGASLTRALCRSINNRRATRTRLEHFPRSGRRFSAANATKYKKTLQQRAQFEAGTGTKDKQHVTSQIGQERPFSDLRVTSAFPLIATDTFRIGRFGPILLKKSEYLLGPIFSAPWVRLLDADAGGLIIHLRLNGAGSKSVCGGN
jgi:hypothetical protein